MLNLKVLHYVEAGYAYRLVYALHNKVHHVEVSGAPKQGYVRMTNALFNVNYGVLCTESNRPLRRIFYSMNIPMVRKVQRNY